MGASMEHRRPDSRPAALRWAPAAALLLLFAAIAWLTLTYRVSGLDWRTLLSPSGDLKDELAAYTVWHVRAPRLLLAASLGAALAVAGCLLQAMTRNPLSDTEIIGLNQGASCAAVVALLLFGGSDSSLVILPAALCGAAVSGVLVYWLARFGGSDVSRLVLSGVAISAFMGALTTGIILLFETRLMEIVYWMAGKLSGANWSDNRLIWLIDAPVLAAAFLLSGRLNLLAQGDEVAAGLGVNVARTRGLLGLMVILLAGSAAAVAGPIGFVGLMVPHMARRIVGIAHRRLIPASALLGAVLLSTADFAAQWISYPADIPVGIVTAFLGVPFFLYLLRRNKEER
ncbi:FecCD family ABC transporter permease [Cohnella cellulosilytica]